MLLRTLGVVALVAATLAGCGDDDDLIVGAASSTRVAFEGLRDAGLLPDLAVSYAGSQAVAAQVGAGAPIAVVVAADRPAIQALVDDDRVQPPVPWVGNRLAIATAPGSEPVADLADLATGRRVVLAASEVPLGRATDAVLAAAGVTVEPVATEVSAAAVVTRLVTGEADAAVVYLTDARAAGLDASPLDGPAAATTYLLAVTVPPADGAADLVDRLRSAEVIEALVDLGFEPTR